MGEQNKLVLALMIVAAVMFAVTLAVYGVNALDTPIFERQVGATSDMYPTGISPSSWTFSIWSVIFLWQPLWLLYAFINICRRTGNGPVYANPVLLTPAFYFWFILSSVAMIAWVFFFDRLIFIGAFVSLFSIVFTVFAAMFTSYKPLAMYGGILIKEGRRVDIWLHRILVHNGLGIYFGWTSVATLINMVHVMVYVPEDPLELETAGTVALGVLTGGTLLYFVTDIFFFDRYSRYTIMPYLVICWAVSGSIDNHWNPEKTNSIFSAVILGLAGAIAVVKIIVTLYRHCKYPMYRDYVVESTIDK
ncbi:hypothetical protein LOTGIDRAFT_163049 [Lottia gigantea]|uniref:Uncharacterized protein n=1 Tax=Lottia gigantea TaxID=225164 RepID=V4AAE3_LOTGI|nr:hypothetical protein LOTGIDRAFT_163049 [Lottia gigantea]ESO92045.1 hypothetical protein LOTGIDRAFT_163049 [Lottia gigantea]